MTEFIDPRTRFWAGVTTTVGIGLYIAMDLIEEPDSSLLDIMLNLLEVTPLVLTTVGIVILFQVTRRQRDDHLQVIRDLEVARLQGAGAMRHARISTGWGRRSMRSSRAGT